MIRRILTYLIPTALFAAVVIAIICSDGMAADRMHIRSGNRAMRGNAEDAASQAEIEYQKAQEANKENPQAMYNMGCVHIAKTEDSIAVETFENAALLEKSPQRKAQSYHNKGVIMQRQAMASQQMGDEQKYYTFLKKAVEEYKRALRLTPHDDETRYNLVLCMEQLKHEPKQNNQDQQNQQNQQDKNNKDNKDDKDQNKDQDNKDNKDNNKDNKDNGQNNQDQDKKNQDDKNKQNNQNNQDNQNSNDQNKQNGNGQQGQNNQQQQKQMSKEAAEQLLEAAMRNEKQTQGRLEKARRQQGGKVLQKNW